MKVQIQYIWETFLKVLRLQKETSGLRLHRMTGALSFEFYPTRDFYQEKAHSSCQLELKANWFKRYNRKECPFSTNWDPVDSPYLPRYVYRFWQEFILANRNWKTEINPKTKKFSLGTISEFTIKWKLTWSIGQPGATRSPAGATILQIFFSSLDLWIPQRKKKSTVFFFSL